MRRRQRGLLPIALGLAGSALLLVSGTPAHATSVLEFPDNGSEQMGRGGAWVARASDPLATVFNPAGLAGQPSRLTLQSNLIFHHTCFTRLKAANDTTQDGTIVDGTGHYPRVCNDNQLNVNPQIGGTLRVSDRLGIGALVIGPSSAGEKTWPEFVNDGSGEPVASPSRYLLARQSGIILFPTIGVGYEIIENLRLGISFGWGLAKLKLASSTVALNVDGTRPDNDVRANLQVSDYFIPRVSAGGIWSATPQIDVAGWYQWTDAIRASGDVGTAANFYTKQNAQGDDKNVRYGDTIFEDCGTGVPQDAGKCGSGDNAKVKLTVPMEAKLGIRFHKPRALPSSLPVSAPPAPGVDEGTNAAAPEATPPLSPPRGHVRDPLATDVFDVELDLTWANNSSIDSLQLRFPGDETGRGKIPVAGVQGGEIPPNGDQPRNYKDVVGIRLGGDYNILPDQLAVRAGGFFETSALDPKYQATDFPASARFGLALGGTYRIRMGEGERAPALELMVGYGHVFFADMQRENANAEGLTALAGTSCNNSTPVSTEKCADGTDRYRTRWPVNLGTITNSINVINVGLAYRF